VIGFLKGLAVSMNIPSLSAALHDEDAMQEFNVLILAVSVQMEFHGLLLV